VIVHPESTGDVSKVMQLCNQFGVPVVAFGGGTSLEGQTMACQGGVSLDMNSMTRVLEVNDQDLDCTVQAGLGYQELNRLLKGGCLHCIWWGQRFNIFCLCLCACRGV
jgi:D-lactate dehydrogenase (cytochrome)